MQPKFSSSLLHVFFTFDDSARIETTMNEPAVNSNHQRGQSLTKKGSGARGGTRTPDLLVRSQTL